MERERILEIRSSRWKREVIPLYDSRNFGVGGESLTRLHGFADRLMDAISTPTKLAASRRFELRLPSPGAKFPTVGRTGAGFPPWIRTTITDFKGLRPTFRRRGNKYGLRAVIRTPDLLIPSQADCQAFLHADGLEHARGVEPPFSASCYGSTGS